MPWMQEGQTQTRVLPAPHVPLTFPCRMSSFLELFTAPHVTQLPTHTRLEPSWLFHTWFPTLPMMMACAIGSCSSLLPETLHKPRGHRVEMPLGSPAMEEATGLARGSHWQRRSQAVSPCPWTAAWEAQGLALEAQVLQDAVFPAFVSVLRPQGSPCASRSGPHLRELWAQRFLSLMSPFPRSLVTSTVPHAPRPGPGCLL